MCTRHLFATEIIQYAVRRNYCFGHLLGHVVAWFLEGEHIYGNSLTYFGCFYGGEGQMVGPIRFPAPGITAGDTATKQFPVISSP